MTFDFAVYGDCRHNAEVHRRIAASMVMAKPAFVLNTGDLVDNGDDEALIAQFREITGDLRKGRDFLPCRGDHEGADATILRKEFSIDKTYYYERVIGDCHIFVLDSTKEFKDVEQLKWLEERATASTAKHKFAVFHHPPFMIDRDRGHEADVFRPKIHPLLVKLKFCAAFCGHQHAFYTTSRDGVRYVVTGGGGAPLWKIDPSLGEPGDLSLKAWHWVGCRFEGGGIRATVVDSYGRADAALSFVVCRH